MWLFFVEAATTDVGALDRPKCGRTSVEVGTTVVVIVAAFVVVGQANVVAASRSLPFNRASSVFVDLSAIVHFIGRTETSLQQKRFL